MTLGSDRIAANMFNALTNVDLAYVTLQALQERLYLTNEAPGDSLGALGISVCRYSHVYDPPCV